MSKAKREFWGLDFETSGTTHERHVPIQLGIAAPNGAVFSTLIGGWRWDTDLEGHETPYPGINCFLWDQRAYEVHRIKQEWLYRAPLPAQVTKEALDFIEEHSNVWHGQRKLVGWNVASFDVPFLRMHLPGVARKLSYQSADLNAVTFAISEAHGLSYKNLKLASKQYAAQQIEALGLWEEEHWHDAGYDALAALHSWAYLTERIKEGY